MGFLFGGAAGRGRTARTDTRAQGDAAEAQAVAWLERRGLRLVQRNYRTPGRGGGEIDAIMRASDGTLVFVEVRLRHDGLHGGAAASIGPIKQRRLILAAQHFLASCARLPACRFDVMAGQPDAAGHLQWEWLQAAFDASL